LPLAGDGVADVLKWLEVDEFCGVVGLAEAGNCFGFMLGDAMEEIVGHADVENAGLAGHDVDVINHWRDFYMIGGVDDSGFGAGRGKEKRGPSATQPNHLTGSEMGRENWVASVGMTGV